MCILKIYKVLKKVNRFSKYFPEDWLYVSFSESDKSVFENCPRCIESFRKSNKNGNSVDSSKRVLRTRTCRRRNVSTEFMGFDTDGTKGGTNFMECAKKIASHSAVQKVVIDGVEKIYGTGTRGSSAYNKREYAKHYRVMQTLKEKSDGCYFITVTPPTGFYKDERPITAREFKERVLSILKSLCHNARGRFIATLQPQENGQPHMHILYFIFNARNFNVEHSRIKKFFDKFNGCDMHFVKEEEVDKCFNYMHRYTRHSAEEFVDARINGDEEKEKACELSIYNVVWASRNGVKCFYGSSAKGFEEKVEEFGREEEIESLSGVEHRMPILPEIEEVLDDFLASGSEELDEKTAGAIMKWIEISYPCIKSNHLIQQKPNGKGACVWKEQVSCKCPWKSIYLDLKEEFKES